MQEHLCSYQKTVLYIDQKIIIFKKYPTMEFPWDLVLPSQNQ